jgi:hypothetical protein
VKFAGVRASETEIRLSSDLAARFLEETRDNAPLVEDPDPLAAPANDEDLKSTAANSPTSSQAAERTHV